MKQLNEDSLFLDKERNVRKYGIENLNEKNVLPIINRSQKNYALSEELWDYIQDNLNSERVDEFGKRFTNLDILDSINNGGVRTKEIEELINSRPKVITEEELGYVNLSLKTINWDLDNVPLPSLVLGEGMEEGDLQNVIMGKVAKNMSHFAKEGKENWDVFMDVYTKLNDVAQNFDPNYDFGDKYDFDELLRKQHGDDVIDKASPSKYKRLFNNKKLDMFLKANIDKVIYSFIREDQMARGMTSTQAEINNDFKQAREMYGNDSEKIAEYLDKKYENSDRKNKIRIDEGSIEKHSRALSMQDTVYLDTNISSDGRETTIGELVEDQSKSALDNMEEQETLKDFINHLDKFFDTEAMMTSSDGADYAWMESKKFTLDRDPSTGDIVVNALTPDEINKIKEESYLKAKKRHVMKSFKSNREKAFGKEKEKHLDDDLYNDLQNVKNHKELDECFAKHVKTARNNLKERSSTKTFNAMKLEQNAEKIALARTQAYFRFSENIKDVSSIIREMDDLKQYLDGNIGKAKTEEDIADAKEKKTERMTGVLEDKFDIINENRKSKSKAPFPESWKRGLFELYNLPMKIEWKNDLEYQKYCQDLKNGKFKGDTEKNEMSLFDMINQKENIENSLKEEFVKDIEDYQKDEISYEEINFLLDNTPEVDKDRSRDETNREISLSL